MAESNYRGHKIITSEKNEWVYMDTKQLIKNNMYRKCAHCGNKPTSEQHDYCISNLIGVKNACCGHGNTNMCYIQFLDDSSVRGKDAKTIIDVLKKHTKEEIN